MVSSPGKIRKKIQTRSTSNHLFQKKAFVAAPLIGTTIFLAAILFTVNLNRLQTADTARIVNDAYHNRIASLIEIYRTDLNSVFRETLRRNIEENILQPGWLTLSIRNTNDAGNVISYRDVRRQRCEFLRSISVDMVCSVSGGAQNAAQNSYGYGIPAWIRVADESFPFEGIRFSPANAPQTSLLNPDVTDVDQLQRYRSACRKLITESSFDCNAFARNPKTYQCLDAAGKPISGCQLGTFFIRVEPTLDPDVYQAMPRIQGDDGFGNTVRSGAIADQTIYLPINIRVYKYDDLALEFYKGLAYGPREDRPDGASEGFVDGLCFGSDKYCLDKMGKRSRAKGRPVLSDSTAEKENFRLFVADTILRGAFTQGRQNVNTLMPLSERRTEQVTLKFKANSNVDQDRCEATDATCKDVFVFTTSDVRVTPLLDPDPQPDNEGPTNLYGLAYGSTDSGGTVSITVFVQDQKPEFIVRGGQPVQVTYNFVFQPSNTPASR